MWQTEEAAFEEADWSRPRGEAGTVLAKGDKDLESPPSLDLTSNNSWVRKSHPRLVPRQEMACFLQQMSMPKDPESSPLCQLA